MPKIDYQKDLNAEQLAVVREGDGPCLVLAGAPCHVGMDSFFGYGHVAAPTCSNFR